MTDWIIPRTIVPGKITAAQELIYHLCAWKGIHTHEEAQHIFSDVFGRPDWTDIVINCIDTNAPIEYMNDDAPNRHHPEWDHLRSKPWNQMARDARKTAEE